MSDGDSCDQCGLVIPHSARFCPTCGAPRDSVRAALQQESAATGVPYAQLLARARGGANGTVSADRRSGTRSKGVLRIGCLIVISLLAITLGIGLLAAVVTDPSPIGSDTNATGSTPARVANGSSRSSAAASVLLQTHMRENFGPPYETAWYGLIGDVTVDGRTAIAETSIFPDREGVEIAETICMALSGFAFANDNRDLGIDRIRVAGQGDVLLASRNGRGSLCESHD